MHIDADTVAIKTLTEILQRRHPQLNSIFFKKNYKLQQETRCCWPACSARNITPKGVNKVIPVKAQLSRLLHLICIGTSTALRRNRYKKLILEKRTPRLLVTLWSQRENPTQVNIPYAFVSLLLFIFPPKGEGSGSFRKLGQKITLASSSSSHPVKRYAGEIIITFSIKCSVAYH